MANMTFNRTRVELKLLIKLQLKLREWSFNRTRVELKLFRDQIPVAVVVPFNRTRVELKHFNSFPIYILSIILLIVPEWN